MREKDRPQVNDNFNEVGQFRVKTLLRAGGASPVGTSTGPQDQGDPPPAKKK